MLVEKYEPSKGEYCYAEFGHRAGLVPSKNVEIMNIQKGPFFSNYTFRRLLGLKYCFFFPVSSFSLARSSSPGNPPL